MLPTPLSWPTQNPKKFGFNAEISMPRGHVIAGHAELQWLGLFATGAILMIRRSELLVF
jgi:hypothetical protein